MRSQTKFGPDRFNRFDVYRIQTNRHPGKLNLYKDEFSYKFDTLLCQFLETGTSDITFMGSDQELK